QPSLFEGWSTVIEDAKSLGKNLIASDLDVHLEQSPINCRFFNRSSAEELALHMGDCWSQFESDFNLNQEKLSISDSISRVQKFGYQFLSIAGVTLS
ncbi:MAG: glycosyltransferase, partial [Dolichospermum sp.]